jgi:hypothetical protein
MIVGDIDFGGRPVHVTPNTGQMIGSSPILGSRTIVWPEGGVAPVIALNFWIQAWQALGGQAANSLGANRYLRQQLKELSLNPDYQPFYVQVRGTAQANPLVPSAVDQDDGWYILDGQSGSLTWDPESYNQAGAIEATMTLTRVAPATPSSLSLWYSGAAMASNYSATAVPLVAFPLGSTAVPATSGSRTGGEGAIPISTSPVPNPVPFVRPATIASLYDGGLRVLDTINTGSNPVPVASGVFLNANWAQVYGGTHDFVGDCVVTNGLVLLLFQTGQTNLCSVYLWNTSLGTPTWQLMGTLEYQDNAANAGTLREINLDRVGMEEVRVRLVASTSSGNYALFKLKLQRGRYDVYAEFWPLTESPTNQLAMLLRAQTAYVTAFTESTTQTTFPNNLATTSTSGYGAAQGSASGSPILGWLFQNIPTTAQGRPSTSSILGYGDSVGPTVGNFKLYGFFVVPYSGSVVLATARGIVAPLFAQYLFDKTLQWIRG